MVINNNIDLFNLIEGCKTQDQSSQTKLYDLYHKRMYNYALRFCHYNNDDDFIDHVLSVVFSYVFRKIDQYNYSGSFDGWLMAIVRNQIYSYMRENKNYRDRYHVMDVFKYLEEDNEHKRLQDNIFVDHNINGSEDLIMNEYFDYIKKSLSNREYEVFMLKYNGFTHKEIGEKLNLNPGTIKWYFFEARLKLRTNFKNKFSF